MESCDVVFVERFANFNRVRKRADNEEFVLFGDVGAEIILNYVLYRVFFEKSRLDACFEVKRVGSQEMYGHLEGWKDYDVHRATRKLFGTSGDPKLVELVRSENWERVIFSTPCAFSCVFFCDTEWEGLARIVCTMKAYMKQFLTRDIPFDCIVNWVTDLDEEKLAVLTRHTHVDLEQSLVRLEWTNNSLTQDTRLVFRANKRVLDVQSREFPVTELNPRLPVDHLVDRNLLPLSFLSWTVDGLQEQDLGELKRISFKDKTMIHVGDGCANDWICVNRKFVPFQKRDGMTISYVLNNRKVTQHLKQASGYVGVVNYEDMTRMPTQSMEEVYIFIDGEASRRWLYDAARISKKVYWFAFGRV